MHSERRLHPFSIIFEFITLIRVFIVPGVLVWAGASARGGERWQPWMMLFIIPGAAFAVVRYLSYRYRYDDNELVIRSGLLFRRERHIPYARIQNIDAVQSLLHRVLGVVEVRIETGGGSRAEATMSVLPLSALAEMRARVFGERHPAPDRDAAADIAPADGPAPLLQLDLRELLLCGFIENRGAILIAAAFGFVWELGLFDRIASELAGEQFSSRGAIRDFVRGITSDAGVSAERAAMTAAAFLVLLLLVRLVSMVWAAVRLHGFTLRLVDGDARTEYGLLTRMTMTVPLWRIQSLTVHEGPLHRLFGRVAVSVDTAGGRADEDGAQSDREHIAPLLRREALDPFVDTLIGLRLDGVDWQAPHPRAFRREVKRWLFIAGVIAVPMVATAGWAAMPMVVVLGAWAVVGARQRIRHLRWAETDEAVLFRAGWLWRRLVAVRFAKIQVVRLHDTPFDRWNVMSRVHVDTAGAAHRSVVDIPYLARETAEQLYRRLAAAAARTAFRW